MTEKRKTGRKPTGTLIWTRTGWAARIPTVVDGEKIKKWYALGTESKQVARRKLARIVAELEQGASPAPETVQAEETVEAYAKDWLEGREARGIRSVEYERFYFKRIWQPAIGQKSLGAVTKADVQAVLDDVATGRILKKPRKPGEPSPGRYSRQSIAHMRATIFQLFQAAWKEELVPENRVAKVDLPNIEEVMKPRAVLVDAEIAKLIAHPDVDAEIKLLVLLSRTIGGLRAGDLNALDWTAFGPDYSTCTFVRRKTRKQRPLPQTFEVPAAVRPFLRAWWDRQERPTTGPVFPVRRGARAGEQKKAGNMSYADRLRRELVRAGVLRHELHHETASTRPVDFHSTRRAYATALARVGVNEQTAMQLTGHADSKVHRGYVDALSAKVLPSAAVPLVDAKAVRTVGLKPTPRRRRPSSDSGCVQSVGSAVGFFERETGFEPATPSLGSLCSTS